MNNREMVELLALRTGLSEEDCQKLADMAGSIIKVVMTAPEPDRVAAIVGVGLYKAVEQLMAQRLN